MTNRTSRVPRTWSLYLIEEGRIFVGAYMVKKKVVLYSRKEIKSGQGAGA